MAFASVDERMFYIQGGLTEIDSNQTPLNQFIALDLTVDSWSTSAPPWEWPQSLTTPPMSSGHSITVSIGRTTLYMWDPFQASAYWSYGTESYIWNSYSNLLNTTKQSGIKNGVDMSTGILYVPSGSNNGMKMIVNTPGSSSLPTLFMPTELMPVPVVHESFLWSTDRNTFLHYGGKSIVGNTGNPYLNEYIPNTTLNASRWAAVTTSGPSPGDVSGHCMVEAYNGRKMIVFGGAGLDGVAKGDIYVLDVPTRVWAVGKPADVSQARTNMACSVSGDSFIAWGGESASMIMDATPIVYDMKNNQWTTQFNRFINAASTTTGPTNVNPPPSSAPTSQSDSPTNIPAIAGGIAGAVVVMFAVAGFLLYRHRRRKRTRTRDSRDQGKYEDEEDVSLAHRQNPPSNTNDDIETERFAASLPPPLNPRPAEDQHAVWSRFSTSSPTELPLTVSHAVLRNPQGQQSQPQRLSTSTNSGDRSQRVDANNEAHHQTTLLPDRSSNQSGTTNIFNGSIGTPQSPRNPQSWSPYKERSQELTRMIANLQEEQEELEKVSVKK